jgi:hypothetical protein
LTLKQTQQLQLHAVNKSIAAIHNATTKKWGMKTAIRRQLRLFLGTLLLCKFTLYIAPPRGCVSGPKLADGRANAIHIYKCDTATPSRCKNNERRRRRVPVLFSGRELHKNLSPPQPEIPVHSTLVSMCFYLSHTPINKCVRVCMYLFQKAISGAAGW